MSERTFLLPLKADSAVEVAPGVTVQLRAVGDVCEREGDPDAVIGRITRQFYGAKITVRSGDER